MTNKYEALYKDATLVFLYDDIWLSSFSYTNTDIKIIYPINEKDTDCISLLIRDEIFNYYKNKTFELNNVLVDESFINKIKDDLLKDHSVKVEFNKDKEIINKFYFRSQHMHKYIVKKIFLTSETIKCIREENTLSFEYSYSAQKDWLMQCILASFYSMDANMQVSLLHVLTPSNEQIMKHCKFYLKHEHLPRLKQLNFISSKEYIKKNMIKTNDDLKTITLKNLTNAQADYIQKFVCEYDEH